MPDKQKWVPEVGYKREADLTPDDLEAIENWHRVWHDPGLDGRSRPESEEARCLAAAA